MKLIPGIDTSKTPALNEAAFSSSQLIRIISDKTGVGLVQKMGGWVNWYGNAAGQSPIPNITELHAWEDLNGIARLAVGANASLSYIAGANGTNIPITPQSASVDLTVNPSQTVTITIASPAVITAAVAPPVGTPVVFTTTGALPTGLTAGTIYTVFTQPTLTTFTVTSNGSSAINTSGTQSGVQTLIIPTVSTTSGSSTITIVDTVSGTQPSVSFTNASPTVVTGTIAPIANTPVVFYGSSLPTGITQGTTYYAQPLTATTFNLTNNLTTGSYSYINTTSTGTGAMYVPNQIQNGYSVYIKTPISISNLILSGVYAVQSFNSNAYYSVYTIKSSSNATSTTYLATVPLFTPTSGLATVTVTQANHSYQTGSTVTFLVSTSNFGITVYGSYNVTYISSTQYQITVSSAATASTAFYMDSLSANPSIPRINFQYFYNIPANYSASGFGTGAFGTGEFGASATQSSVVPAATITSTDWTINNFGQILVACPENGPIYYWDPSQSSPTARLVNNAPTQNLGIFIAMPARQVVAYGSTRTGIQDPLLVAWSDAADATVWLPSANNQAGSYRIPEGSRIVGAFQTIQQAFIWTDISMWAMQYIGLPNVYGFTKVGDGVGMIAKKAVGSLNNVTYWMSQQNFNMYSNGGPQTIVCPVWDNVFQNINTNYYSSIRCATNTIFNEVTWFYPSIASTTGINDSYVKYNTVTQAWDYGTLSRTAWIDQSVLGPPIGASSNGIIYQHEIGYNNDGSSIVSSFQTGYMQLSDADDMVFVDQVWPDFKWTTAGGGTGGLTTPASGTNASGGATTMYVTFYGTNYPGDTPTVYGPYAVTQGTEYISTRIRNRLLAIGISTADQNGNNAQLNSFFRIGALRYRYQTDGKF
jgi:hypothetical protein